MGLDVLTISIEGDRGLFFKLFSALDGPARMVEFPASPTGRLAFVFPFTAVIGGLEGEGESPRRPLGLLDRPHAESEISRFSELESFVEGLRGCLTLALGSVNRAWIASIRPFGRWPNAKWLVIFVAGGFFAREGGAIGG